MEKIYGALGRALIVNGIVPVFFWLILNVCFVFAPEKGFGERLEVLLDQKVAGILIAVVIPLGALLTACNRFILYLYEGEYRFEHFPLHALNRLTGSRRAEVYADVVAMRAERDSLLRTPPERVEVGVTTLKLGALDNVLKARYHELEARGLPLNPKRAKLTALGNAWAMMEDYPLRRYGMEAMVFWPRLGAVMPREYQEQVGNQKITCDFLLHLAFLASLYGVEALVVGGWLLLPDGGATGAGLQLLASSAVAFVAGYGIYRAAVAETLVLGDLFKGGFDLYRGELLARFTGGATIGSLEEERRIWEELERFIRFGEDPCFRADYPARHVAPGTPGTPGAAVVDED